MTADASLFSIQTTTTCDISADAGVGEGVNAGGRTASEPAGGANGGLAVGLALAATAVGAWLPGGIVAWQPASTKARQAIVVARPNVIPMPSLPSSPAPSAVGECAAPGGRSGGRVGYVGESLQPTIGDLPSGAGRANPGRCMVASAKRRASPVAAATGGADRPAHDAPAGRVPIDKRPCSSSTNDERPPNSVGSGGAIPRLNVLRAPVVW